MKDDVTYLIVGSGIAGLTLAIQLSEIFPKRKITIVSKSNETDSNTRHAQGGIAVVVDKIKDSYQKHIEDTLSCGDGLCDPEVVSMVVSEGPKRLKQLMAWGALFDKDINGSLALAKEGGHSAHRIVHRKDRTGFEIEQAILAKVHKLHNVDLLEHHFATDLMVHENKCVGSFVLDCKTSQVFAINADFTILATGGIGQLYAYTTNSKISTGDGIAMAFRAKAKIRDMEFIQFHPTAFYNRNTDAVFLISEALRGFGAYLRNKDGDRFLFDYNADGELATRDIVSQAIASELKQSREVCVFIDCTHLDSAELVREFPTIHHYCDSQGIDFTKEWIPVVPAQHYLCGGIAVDTHGRTTVERLFAVGECSATGLHGANRLASNSLLEALVYAHRVFKFLRNEPINTPQNDAADLPIASLIGKNEVDHAGWKKRLRHIMSTHAAIVRNNESLAIAHQEVSDLAQRMESLVKSGEATIESFELYNMATVAVLILKASIERNENRGSFIKQT